MNQKLKDYAIEKLGVAKDASDEEFTKAIADALVNGKLSQEDHAKMLGKTKAPTADEISAKLAESVSKSLGGHFDALLKALKPEPSDAEKKAKEEAEAKAKKEAEEKASKERDEQFAKAVEDRVKAALDSLGYGKQQPENWADPNSILTKKMSDGENDPIRIRVKQAADRFDKSKKAATYKSGPFKDRPIEHMGRTLDDPSQLEKALVVAWTKFEVCPEYLTEHDSNLIKYILHEEPFYVPGEIQPRKLREDEAYSVANLPRGLKGSHLIDDSTSGGQHSVPEFFDRDMILLPILGGEVSPLVHVVDVPRGSAAQNFTMGNPTFAAANTEGSSVSLFSTTSFIANHDTTFYRAAGAFSLGLNYMLDAVPGMASEVEMAYGRKAAEWLDEQIAIGDGTTEPQGIFNASGTTDITAGTPTTGPLTITDALNLLFGVSKAFRYYYPTRQAAYMMTDASYKRFRQIATGVTGDTRLIFGMDVESYTMFGHPVAIVGTGLADNQIAFCQFGGYRLYRRQGLRLRRTTEGDTNLRQNTMTIVADMRFGGQLDRGGYAAVMDSAPTS